MSSINNLNSLFSPSGMLMSNLTSQLQSKAMKKMDADADGSVTKSEFQAAMQKAAGKLGVELGDDEASEMFAGFDADSSGALDKDEVGGVVTGLLSSLGNAQSFMQSRESGFNADSFSSRDLDGDGMLSLSEFTGQGANASMARVTVTTQTIEMPIGSDIGLVGTEGQNQTTPPSASAEAPSGSNALESLMASLDSDKDGQISAEELSAFVSQIDTVVQRYNDSLLARSSGSGQTGQA